MNMRTTRRNVIGLIALTPTLLAVPARARGRGIDESGFVPIGAIDQWIGIQGDDVRNPAILYLHGGPGEAQSPFLKQFIPWQREYTVVNWDQRGSGRTYARNGASTPGMSTPELALERLCEDAREVAQYVCKRLSKRKIIFSLPFVVVQGRDDHIAPFEVAEAYVAEVRAPKKAFVPIDGGHWACFTNPEGFLTALRQHVQPLAS